jgi:hypothetical protein
VPCRWRSRSSEGLGVAGFLRYVGDCAGYLHPGMHALLVHGYAGRRERWVGKCADGDCDKALWKLVVDRGAAVWAEVEGDSCSFVSDANELLGCARDGDGLLREARLCTKDTSRALLTSQAVTDGHADWVGSNLGL